MTIMNTIKLFSLSLGAVISLTSGSFAQESDATANAPTAGSSGWGVQCNTTADGLQCSASLTVVSSPDNQRIISLSFQEGAGDAQPTLVMHLPFGLNLPRGVDLTVDDGEAQTFTINTCLQTGCFVVQESENALIQAMKAGNLVTVSMESSNGAETRLQVSLAGFAAAMERLN